MDGAPLIHGSVKKGVRRRKRVEALKMTGRFLREMTRREFAGREIARMEQ
jgi:hypothetical protein